MPKLSIITICYNDPDAYKTCESIVNQTFQDFEWIIIDGGSKKEILDIFKKYENRINNFITEPDEGLYDAYNKGLKLASAPYVHFLNSGDIYHNNNVLKNIFENKKYDSDILYCDINFIKNSQTGEFQTVELPNRINKYFFINENIATPCAFIKRELFNKYGNFSTSYKIVSDLERWIVFAQNNAKFQHIPIIAADFDTTGISSSKQNKNLHLAEKKELYNKYYTYEEYINAVKNYKIKLKFKERIFSIKNSPNSEFKIVTILNFHIKIKRKNNKGDK
ncbi:glycosyltransferase [bacterium]|nr:glycosyltransferase [bacterium]